MHKFLKSLRTNEYFESVYLVDYKRSHVNDVKVSSKGNKYIFLKIKDSSMESEEYATVLYFYKKKDDILFLQETNDGRTRYLKINGKCIKTEPIIIISNNIVPANKDSGIIFDTSNLYTYDNSYEIALLSQTGMNVSLRHTSVKAFQDDFDIIDIGCELKYKRIINSPYDRYQINVIIEDIDEIFNIPAYLTPTMGKMIDEGYVFKIVVTKVHPKDINQNKNAGIVVNIRGSK